MRRRNAQILSAQALNNLFHFLIIHILPLIFCKNLFTGDLRSIFFSCRAVTARVGRVTACLTALFTLLSTTSASEQDILKVRKIENPIRKTSRIKKKNITNKNLNIFRHLVGLLHKHKDTNSCLPSFVKKRQGYIENDCSGNAQNTKESHKDHRPGH